MFLINMREEEFSEMLLCFFSQDYLDLRTALTVHTSVPLGNWQDYSFAEKLSVLCCSYSVQLNS